jgi:hypothetical protein
MFETVWLVLLVMENAATLFAYDLVPH